MKILLLSSNESSSERFMSIIDSKEIKAEKNIFKTFKGAKKG